NLNHMFSGCSSLTSVSGNFFTGNISSKQSNIDGGYIFGDCPSLENIDITWSLNFNRLQGLFYNCSNLKTINSNNYVWPIVSSWQLSNVRSMFSGCTSLEFLDAHDWGAPHNGQQLDMSYMFENTPKLRRIDFRSMPFNQEVTAKIFGDHTGASVGQPLLVIVNPDSASNFLNFNFVQESGRAVADFPVLDANGGTFSSGEQNLKYLNRICVTPSEIEIGTFNNWKNQHIPTKSGESFAQWTPSKTVTNPSSVLDLI
ncbi:leucine-rich repeat protein, partial [Enterococcus faecalis]|uniref:leucine-rich repeat protein n=1 Tax=Enterococcus faecalis TaxID=1351 RepID=UPI0018845BE1